MAQSSQSRCSTPGHLQPIQYPSWPASAVQQSPHVAAPQLYNSDQQGVRNNTATNCAQMHVIAREHRECAASYLKPLPSSSPLYSRTTLMSTVSGSGLKLGFKICYKQDEFQFQGLALQAAG